ncbi:hypothetical protein EVAR_68711_1 [Eumeta japonica]|uniref:Uncharacterized protein n=1 Tax=Eumeta variegata TaxID=151549 RepID=A0A4C2A2J1_EUMVA|nr:hypothetical protein EVAR_68711_1 [Eumeta japonica]
MTVVSGLRPSLSQRGAFKMIPFKTQMTYRNSGAMVQSIVFGTRYLPINPERCHRFCENARHQPSAQADAEISGIKGLEQETKTISRKILQRAHCEAGAAGMACNRRACPLELDESANTANSTEQRTMRLLRICSHKRNYERSAMPVSLLTGVR